MVSRKSEGKRERTSHYLDKELVAEVQASGVRNMSAHIEKLLRQDLKQAETVGRNEIKKVLKLQEDLKGVEQEWFRYLKKIGEQA